MKRGTKKEQEERRMKAIPLLDIGVSQAEIADYLGVTQGAVSQWKTAYEENGREGLISIPHPGRKPRLSEKDFEELVEILEKGAIASGFPTELWTLPRVAEVIRDKFGVDYHDSHISKIMKKIGWSKQKPEKHAKEQNVDEVEHWRNVRWPEINARCQR
jgi:transposase